MDDLCDSIVNLMVKYFHCDTAYSQFSCIFFYYLLMLSFFLLDWRMIDLIDDAAGQVWPDANNWYFFDQIYSRGQCPKARPVL